MKKSKVSAIFLPASMIFGTVAAITTKENIIILFLGICAILMAFGIVIVRWIDEEEE